MGMRLDISQGGFGHRGDQGESVSVLRAGVGFDGLCGGKDEGVEKLREPLLPGLKGKITFEDFVRGLLTVKPDKVNSRTRTGYCRRCGKKLSEYNKNKNCFTCYRK